MGHFFWNVR